MLKCRQCGETKPESDYYKKGPYLKTPCKECTKLNQRERYRLHPEIARAYRERERDRRNASRRAWYRRLREAGLRAYGDYACACCGESEPAFLVLDHIDGGGNRHRSAIGGVGPKGGRLTHSFWLWLRVNGYPPGFQVLCANCNTAKSFNPQGCPHALRVAG